MSESPYWSRFWRRRVSRRTLLGAGAVTALGAAGAAVVGCNSGGAPGTPDDGVPRGTPIGPDATPQPGGTITWGRSVAALGIDPHVDLTGLDLDSLMYCYLYSWNPASEEMILNNLATDFEQPDPDNLEFIFTLRPDAVAWPVGPGGQAHPSAGEPLTSTDCVESFKRRGTALTAPDKRFPQRIESYDTPDSQTFRFTMSRPFVPAIREMANPTWAIVPAKVLEQHTSLSQVAFGNGPFMLEEFRGTERIVLKKHPDYFLSPQPWLDGITYIVITDNSSLLAAFRSGQHDVNGAVLDKSTAEDLASNENFIVNSAPTLFYPVIHLKMRPPWNDIRVREALDLAINRDEIIEVIQEGEANYNGPIQWPQFKWALPQDELRSFYRYDPEAARQLLQEAGQTNITSRMKAPRLTGPTIFADIAQLIQNQVRQVGINIELDFVELGTFISSVILPGNFDMAFFPNLPYDEPDRPLSFYHSRGVTGTGNWTNYNNPDLDELIDAQSEVFDEAERLELILRAQRMILPEHGPQITLTSGFQHFAHWNHVYFGANTPGYFEPDAEFGPYGTDIWTSKA